jgi:hypothetical protein
MRLVKTKHKTLAANVKEKTMLNKRFWFRMLALVFGIALIGCDSGSGKGDGGINLLDTFNFSTKTPSSTALSAGGLNQTQFNYIKDAADGGFYGWAIDENQELLLAWTGCTVSDFIAVEDALVNLFDQESREYNGNQYFVYGYCYFITFTSTKFYQNGFYIPVGAIIVKLNSNGDGDINYLDTINFSTGTPSANALLTGGLTQAQFNQIRNAAGGGFQGWFIREGDDEHQVPPSLRLAWTGRNEFNFNTAADTLGTLFGEEYRYIDRYDCYAMGDGYIIIFHPTRSSWDGFYYPAGTMFVFLGGSYVP